MAVLFFIILFVVYVIYKSNKSNASNHAVYSSEENFIDEDEYDDNDYSYQHEFPVYNEPEVIPVEEHIKSAIPDKYGLYPHEILAIEYAPTFFVGENSFQGFWWYKYGVKDVAAILSSLLERGFITGGDIEATVRSKTIPELKKLLEENGLSAKGKKGELVQAVLDGIPEDKLKSSLGQLKYGITEKGKDAVKCSEYVVTIHKDSKSEVDVWEVNKSLSDAPENNWSGNDKIWASLNQKCIEAIGQRNFGIYRNIKLNMYGILCKEEKFEPAYKLLIEVVYYDINSYLDNNYDKEFLGLYLSSYFDPNETNKIPPGTFKQVNDLQKRLSITDEKLKSDFIAEWNRYHLPVNIFTAEECANIYFLERENKTTELKKIYSERKKKYIQIIRKFDD